ncbi:hypothetical protein K1719_011708 [Acacia pycnantha]|nr:hypothetical protein K1719_011708 [Acacia pycnantha]
MRPSLVFSLLLLSLLLAKVQGIRLDRGSLAAVQQQKQHDDEESNLMEKSNGEADDEVILCKDEQCTGKVKSRKLVTTSISSSHELPKNKEKKEGDDGAHSSVNGNTTRMVKLDGKEEGIKVQTLATSELHNHEQYPDFVDIAEMDYSPARRKTPIHN